MIAACFFLSGKCPYAYGYSNFTTSKLNETQIAEKLIDDTFTTPAAIRSSKTPCPTATP